MMEHLSFSPAAAGPLHPNVHHSSDAGGAITVVMTIIKVKKKLFSSKFCIIS